MAILKVEGFDNLYKDTETGVIINKNVCDRDRYRIAKQQALMNVQAQYETKQLRDEVSELKSLIKQLLEK